MRVDRFQKVCDKVDMRRGRCPRVSLLQRKNSAKHHLCPRLRTLIIRGPLFPKYPQPTQGEVGDAGSLPTFMATKHGDDMPRVSWIPPFPILHPRSPLSGLPVSILNLRQLHPTLQTGPVCLPGKAEWDDTPRGTTRFATQGRGREITSSPPVRHENPERSRVPFAHAYA